MKGIANHHFWARFLRDSSIPSMLLLRPLLRERILPTFNNVQAEADKIREKERERLNRSFGPDSDPADFFEQIEMAGVEHYQRLMGIKQGVINLFIVAIYHALEQQLLFVYRKELLTTYNENDPSKLSFTQALQSYKDADLDLESFSNWESVYQLKLIANTIKHADGHSSEKLKGIKPELFYPRDFDILFGEGHHNGPAKTQVFEPIFGDDLFITVEEYEKYVDDCVEFLEVLAERMIGLLGEDDLPF